MIKENLTDRPRHDVVLATPPPISHRTAEENLGLGYLAAVLRKEGHGVKVIDGWLQGLTPHQMAEEILNDPPAAFLGFSCYRSNMDRTMEVASLLKRSGLEVPLVVGGFGPTFHSEEFLNAGFDVVVKGEAEETVLDVYNHFTEGDPDLGQILGISYIKDGEVHHNLSRPLLQDLDSLPFPSRDTVDLTVERRSAANILSARGCQAHCVFCSIVAFQRLSEGPQWRQRSVKNFVDELEEVSSMGVRHFKVIDDSLIEPPRDERWAESLADEIERRNLNVRLRGSIRADRVTDNLMKELKRAGFFAFSCGIENGSDSALKRMGKSANLEQNVKALEVFKKHGMYVQAGHILFDHSTTMDELEENYEFMNRFIWTISKGIFTEMYAAEGTPFTKRLQNIGILDRDKNGLGNNKYTVLNEDSRKVYYSLRAWQKSHSRIYDMTIDPISAPKALDEHELQLFHPLCIELRKKDLVFMRNVLDMVHESIGEKEIMLFTQQEIIDTQSWYEKFAEKVNKVYEKTNLKYDADDNPFIS